MYPHRKNPNSLILLLLTASCVLCVLVAYAYASITAFTVLPWGGSGATSITPNEDDDAKTLAETTFRRPTNLVYDVPTNSILVTEYGPANEPENGRLRVIDAATEQAKTAMDLYGPHGVLSAYGGVFVTTAHCVLYMNITDTLLGGSAILFAGNCEFGGSTDGHRLDALFNLPTRMIDASFNDEDFILIVDSGNNQIRKLVMGSWMVSTFSGTTVSGFQNGPPSVARFNSPYGILSYNGTFLVTDAKNHCVRTLDNEGNAGTFLGTCGQPGFADGLQPLFNEPRSIDYHRAWDGIIIADSLNNRIRFMDNNNYTHTIAGNGSSVYADGINGTLNNPHSVFMVNETTLLIADTDNWRIRMLHCPNPVYIGTDADGDGFVSAETAIGTCFAPSYILSSPLVDCNDTDPSVHEPRTFYRDEDRDGCGNPQVSITVCLSTPPQGFEEVDYINKLPDIDDTDPTRCWNVDETEPSPSSIPVMVTSSSSGDAVSANSSPFSSSSSSYSVPPRSSKSNASQGILIGVLAAVAGLFVIIICIGVAAVVLLILLRKSLFTGRDPSKNTMSTELATISTGVTSTDKTTTEGSSQPLSSATSSNHSERSAASWPFIAGSAKVQAKIAEVRSSLSDVPEINPDDLKGAQKIGKGSFGVVYKARIPSLHNGGFVAAKHIAAMKHTKDEPTQLRILDEFHNEVKLLASLRHKNVVSLVGVVITPPDLYIITEFMDRGTLYSWLHSAPAANARNSSNKTGAHGWITKLKLLTHIASGLEYIHSKRVIHRDMKSENVLLQLQLKTDTTKSNKAPSNNNDDSRENLVAKITDLGIAKKKAESTQSQHHSAMNTQHVGTSLWMAPEVTIGDKYGTACDVYSFAIIMSEMLSGKMPYHNVANKASIHIQASMYPEFRPSVEPIQADLAAYPRSHEHFISLMKQCWAHSPEDRPSMAVVLREITEVKNLAKQEQQQKQQH